MRGSSRRPIIRRRRPGTIPTSMILSSRSRRSRGSRPLLIASGCLRSRALVIAYPARPSGSVRRAAVLRAGCFHGATIRHNRGRITPASGRAGPNGFGVSEPNTYGLYEICENVHEWCSDWFQADYYSRSPERNPRGPESGDRKSSRGGSWRHHVKIARCSARSSIPPQFQYADYGFRVARGIV